MTARKLYTYVQHTVHARAHTSHTWTDTSTEIQRDTTHIPAAALRIGKYTYYEISSDGLSLRTWQLQRRRY